MGEPATVRLAERGCPRGKRTNSVFEATYVASRVVRGGVKTRDMDDTDSKIVALLLANPRISIRELAKRLGISRQSAHHRMRILVETGVVKGTTAGISFLYLDAVSVAIFGRSDATLTEETFDRLGENGFTRRAAIAGGNYLYVVGELRDISELDAYVEFVKQAGTIPEPFVGIYSTDDELMRGFAVDGSGRRKDDYRQLSTIDLRIIASLREDARRPAAEIAKIVGVSAKTVRNHLERMTSDGSLDLHVLTDIPSGGNLLFALHVDLKHGTDKVEVGRRLLSKYGSLDAYMRSFSNIPGLLVVVFWSDSVPEIRNVFRATCEDEGVRAVMLNFCYFERIYETWRGKLLGMQERAPQKGRVRRPLSVRTTQ
jgi:Lrp/AsnC family leucine-responsive transcriptional regulator